MVESLCSWIGGVDVGKTRSSYYDRERLVVTLGILITPCNLARAGENPAGRVVRRALADVDVPSLRAAHHALADAVVLICWVHVYLLLYGLGMLGLPGGSLYSIRPSIQLDLDVTSCACSPLNSACIPLVVML